MMQYKLIDLHYGDIRILRTLQHSRKRKGI